MREPDQGELSFEHVVMEPAAEQEFNYASLETFLVFWNSQTVVGMWRAWLLGLVASDRL